MYQAITQNSFGSQPFFKIAFPVPQPLYELIGKMVTRGPNPYEFIEEMTSSNKVAMAAKTICNPGSRD